MLKAPNKLRALAAPGGFCLPSRGPVISRTDIFVVGLTPSFLCHPSCFAITLKPWEQSQARQIEETRGETRSEGKSPGAFWK